MNKLNNLLDSIAKPFMPITPWLLRLGLGISFILHGQGKLPLPPERMVPWFESMGYMYPELVSSLVAIGEIAAGVGIIFGGLLANKVGHLITRLSGGAVGDRYVGFGFVWDPEGDGMVVDYVVPESPAATVLMEGDSFVEVNGTRLTNENRNRLGFRGLPGENVDAVVMRDGVEMPISIARGPVQIRYSKDQVLNNISNGDAEGWGPEDFNIVETGTTNDGVVYVLHWSEFVEDATGYEANAYTVTRFMFDDSGKVSWIGNLSEDRFVLEQQGYSITR